MIDLSTDELTRFHPYPTSRRFSESFVVATAPSAPTLPSFGEFIRSFEPANDVATYLTEPITPTRSTDLFGEGLIRPIRVSATITIGGSFTHPPIDSELVYFDE